MTDQVLLADQRVANRHDSLRADRLQVRFHRPRTLGLIARQQRTVAWAPGVHQHVGEQPRADQLTQHADVIAAGKSVGLSGLGHHIAYVDPARLAMSRLPNAWPSSAPPWKRYSNSWVISGSDSASATRQSRMSPGGRMPSSRRSRPELPPSSNTVTTAVRLLVNSFNPRSSVERPVPPPMTTMRGPRRRR